MVKTVCYSKHKSQTKTHSIIIYRKNRSGFFNVMFKKLLYVIHKVHISVVLNRRIQMSEELNHRKYWNITIEFVVTYLRPCEPRFKESLRKRILLKTVLHTEMNSQRPAQFDKYGAKSLSWYDIYINLSCILEISLF